MMPSWNQVVGFLTDWEGLRKRWANTSEIDTARTAGAHRGKTPYEVLREKLS
jgi:hypothetical protein